MTVESTSILDGFDLWFQRILNKSKQQRLSNEIYLQFNQREFEWIFHINLKMLVLIYVAHRCNGKKNYDKITINRSVE